MKFILIFLITAGVIFSQTKDPDKILEAVKSNFNKVNDYEVDVKIKVDVDFIKVPVSEAKIFYKQPDKIHIKSDKFALVPREGLNFSPLSLLKEKYTALYRGEEYINDRKLSVVKVIPVEDKGDIILTTLWIDQEKNIIRKIETTTKTSGTFSIDLKYEESKSAYPLPSAMIFSFNVEQLNMPKGMTGEKENKKKEKTGDGKGKVFINYSNYSINKGIPDSFFDQQKK